MMRAWIVGVVVAAAFGTVGEANQPAASAATGPIAPADAPEVAKFTVRAGYEVSVAVLDLPGARMLEIDDRGTLYVSRPQMGDIVALRDTDADGVYETRATFLTDRPSVHAMCFVPEPGGGGWLWFATSGSVCKARDTNADGKADEVVDVIPVGSLPRGGPHWWRSLLVHDGSIYTSIGDSANASDQTETERQKIWRFNLDGSNKRLFASGIRNTEKLRVRPGTGEIWGVDHGSDWFGKDWGDAPGNQPFTDTLPSDEFNRYVEGGFYGHPFLTGRRVPRPEFLGRSDLRDWAAKTVIPEWEFPAHWATNAFCFVEPAKVSAGGAGLPADQAGDAYVACRGSWNSSVYVGYCVARVVFDRDEKLGGRPMGMEVIVRTVESAPAPGFVQPAILARPVDCVQAPDGSILFSADQPGRVYRIRAAGK
jgi:glucose/arabinose dehydrogenase